MFGPEKLGLGMANAWLREDNRCEAVDDGNGKCKSTFFYSSSAV